MRRGTAFILLPIFLWNVTRTPVLDFRQRANPKVAACCLIVAWACGRRMAYRFKLQEPLAQEARRVAPRADRHRRGEARQQGRRGERHSRRPPLPEAAARLIRLVRPALGDGVYRRETERVAGAGRLLAGARDVHVMRLTASQAGEPLRPAARRRRQAPTGYADRQRRLPSRPAPSRTAGPRLLQTP